ncbi:Dipeptidyl peptidase 3 [Orchesella cincta]|uniref:Dipeptidyl peptidase 3 n=1 Tax=Orchesella cincta TaxID=48709 RepID=A0A1D2N1N5_ORCCI|nr:Dipeptidyl peptidase 3 [Orchesella cincta]
MDPLDNKALSRYILQLDTPVLDLDCSEAFNGLTDQEKSYAYYLSQASWIGGLIVNVQTSPESPAIFCLLHDLFKSNGLEGLKTLAVGDCEFSEDEWKALLVYTSGVFENAGNYKSYGDTKIIPGLPLDKLEMLVKKAKFSGHENDDSALKKWNDIKDKVYSLSAREKQLGLGPMGITTYFSSNCTHFDSERINLFMKKQGLEGYITRCFKTVKDDKVSYEIRSASVETDDEEPESHVFQGCDIRLTKGDYSPLMKKMCKYLEKAKVYASNDTQKKMLERYIDSFTKGSLDPHKDGSRFWIQDKGPIVETYIGFIETYRDPTGTRGEFEGFVSVVNRQMSAKFNELVEKAPDFLKLLPWPTEFEKDEFLKPDFTSLDVITFSGSGIPAGINIPNYDEIRQSEGFKNVSLGNVITSSFKDKRPLPFLSDKDKEIFKEYRMAAFELQVGIHELLGHGSGKLLKKNADGTTNYPSGLKNPLTNDLIESAYEDGETYDSVFTTLGSGYEECRAESVGIFLCLDKTVVKIFGYEGDKADTLIYANWLDMVFVGVKSLEMYQPETESWMQAHSQASYVILQVLIEAGEGLVTIVEKTGTDGKPDLDISLDRTKIDTVGRKAMADFLLKQQVYKATADIKSARKMFERYSAVNNDGQHPWAKWRDIVLDKKKPRSMFVQPNLSLNGAGKVQLKCYDSSPEGLIQSWIERFQDENIYEDLEYCRMKDKPHF